MCRLEIYTVVMFVLTTLSACLPSRLSFVRQDIMFFVFLFTLLEWERRLFFSRSAEPDGNEPKRSVVRRLDIGVFILLLLTLLIPAPTITLAFAFLGIIEGLFHLFWAVAVRFKRYVPGLASSLLALIAGARALTVFWSVEIPERGLFVATNAIMACGLFFVMESGANRALARCFGRTRELPRLALKKGRLLIEHNLETLTLVMFGLSAGLSVFLGMPTYFQKAALVYMLLYTLHEWEERRLSGGFIQTYARLKGVDFPDSRMNALYVPGAATIVLMTVVPLATGSPALTLVPIYFGLLEAATCLGAALTLRKLYLPGLVTGLALAVASVWNLTIYARLGLATGPEYFLGGFWLLVVLGTTFFFRQTWREIFPDL